MSRQPYTIEDFTREPTYRDIMLYLESEPRRFRAIETHLESRGHKKASGSNLRAMLRRLREAGIARYQRDRKVRSGPGRGTWALNVRGLGASMNRRDHLAMLGNFRPERLWQPAGSLGLLVYGVDPETIPPDEYAAAQRRIRELAQEASGLILKCGPKAYRAELLAAMREWLRLHAAFVKRTRTLGKGGKPHDWKETDPETVRILERQRELENVLSFHRGLTIVVSPHLWLHSQVWKDMDQIFDSPEAAREAESLFGELLGESLRQRLNSP